MSLSIIWFLFVTSDLFVQKKKSLHFLSQVVGSKVISVKGTDNKELIAKIFLLKIKKTALFFFF